MKLQKLIFFTKWMNNGRINETWLILSFTAPQSFQFLYSRRTFLGSATHPAPWSTSPSPSYNICPDIFPLTFPFLDLSSPLFPYYFYSLYIFPVPWPITELLFRLCCLQTSSTRQSPWQSYLQWLTFSKDFISSLGEKKHLYLYASRFFAETLL